MKNHLLLGNWNALCDSCGRKYKASDLKKRWDGLMVCSEDWEMRHPQDLLRVQKEQISVPWSRPYPAEDSYITNFGLVDNITINSYDTQDYVDLDYFLQNYMQDNFDIVTKWYRTFNDQLNVLDALLINDKAVMTDSIALSEAITVTRRFVRTFTDTATASDALAAKLSKALTDLTLATDSFARSVKYARTVADTFTTSEATSFVTKKQLADTTVMTDALSYMVRYFKTFSDTATPADSGNIFYNNYVGPLYFAEDYVGTTTTF
jgi:hypothetical protein